MFIFIVLKKEQTLKRMNKHLAHEHNLNCKCQITGFWPSGQENSRQETD